MLAELIKTKTMTYTGKEGGPNIPAPFNAIAFDYDRQAIETLLNRPHPNGAKIAGIRFHFDLGGFNDPGNPIRLVAIGVTAGGPSPQEVFTPGSPDYITNDGATMTRTDFESIILHSANGDKVNPCIYLSRKVLKEGILDADQDRTGIRLFVIPFQGSFKTLTAIGLNSGMLDGNFFRSEMPCPPNCGSDY